MKYIGYEILYDKKYKKWFIISATGPKYLSSHVPFSIPINLRQ